MLVDRDHHGWCEWCLQCGYRHELIDIIKVQLQDKAVKRRAMTKEAWEAMHKAVRLAIGTWEAMAEAAEVYRTI